MGRIRICQLITELGQAGAERCVYELATRLDPARFEVHVAALRGGPVAGWLARRGVPVHVIDLRGKWDVHRMGRLEALLRKLRPHVLHTHLFHADLAGRVANWLTGQARIVHTVHVAERRFRPWRFAFARLTSAGCDRVVCVSPSVRTHWLRASGMPPGKVEVISDGIDVDAYACDPVAGGKLRKELGLPVEAVVAAFVGRLDVQKGVDTLVAALADLADLGRPVDILVAGEGPMRPVLEQYVAEGAGGERCRLLGLVDDVPAVLSAADLLVLPSRWEGWGLAVGEAMAAGLPVVATRVEGIRDVQVAGQTGLLVPPDDPDELAGAIEHLLTRPDLRERMGQAGLARVREQFDISGNIIAHERLYEELVATAGKP
jgi:glycosyltransferase involved in cell wall biosynthesis